MFPESPAVQDNLHLKMGGWVLSTMFSGDHWQAGAGVTTEKYKVKAYDSGAWPSKGKSLKMYPRRKGPAGRSDSWSIPGTFLCGHILIVRLQTQLLQLSLTLSSASSYLTSYRKLILWFLMLHPHLSFESLWISWCGPSKAPSARPPRTPGSRIQCEWMPYLYSSHQFCPVRILSHTHSGTGQEGCDKFQKHRYL